MRVVVLLLACAACGRTAVLEPQIAGDTDTQPLPPTLCGGDAATLAWVTPEFLTDVDALLESQRVSPNTNVFDPILSEDGLTLFVTTDISGPWLVYKMTRPSLTASFDTIAALPSDVNQTGVYPFGYQQLDSLNISLVFGNYPIAGYAANTYLMVLADTATSPHDWVAPAVNRQRANNGDPRLTADGLGLIFASAITADNVRNLFYSERASLTDDFTAVTPIGGLTGLDDSAPWISADKRTMFFAHSEDNTQPSSDMWVATRDDAAGPFTTVTMVPSLSSPYFDGEPYVFESGGICELYTVQELPEHSGFRLYRSHL